MIAVWRLPASLRALLQPLWDSRYTKVDQAQEQDTNGLANKDLRPGLHTWLRRLFLLASRRPFSTLSAVLLAVLAAATLYQIQRHGEVTRRQEQSRYLYLLIPSSHADTELCKTVLTAQILGYPAPHLIHWDMSLDYPDRTSLRHMEKLRLTRDFLQQLPEHAQDGIVLLLDGSNSWFQLRPETLLNRYFKVVEEANGRLYDSIPDDVIAEEDLEPRIVFSAQDHCIAGTENLPLCSAAPRVTTAQSRRNLRWLSMGYAVGPVRDMLALYQRAVAKAEKSESGVHDHEIMGEIYAEQELQHQIIRSRYLSWWRKIQRSVDGWLGREISSANARTGNFELKEGTPDEFKITLDYANELGFAVVSGFDDVAFSTHHEQVPADVADSMPPYWTVSGHGVPTNNTWSDIHLLTDHRSNSVPAIVSFNYDEGHVLDLQQIWWQKLWLQPYARKLYDSAAVMPNQPAASVLDGSGTEHTFWPSAMTMDKAGVRSMDGTWLSFEQLCGDDSIAQELFGDGLGQWTNPAP